MGDLEVRDQVDGVRWLAAQGLADPRRVGVYGWSYGGYMAAMCLARAPETFKAAVAGAPVTAWDGYDTHYTERYMGTPGVNPEGYRRSSVMAHIADLTGALMLVHGLIDENVHFRHTARLINALIQARQTYDLLLFPDERHMPRKLADRVFMEEQIRDFLLRELAG
jgi:dipeptidyl-peptidase-4